MPQIISLLLMSKLQSISNLPIVHIGPQVLTAGEPFPIPKLIFIQSKFHGLRSNGIFIVQFQIELSLLSNVMGVPVVVFTTRPRNFSVFISAWPPERGRMGRSTTSVMVC